MKTFKYFGTLERVGSRGWRGILENTRRIVGLLSRVLLSVSGGFSTGNCIAMYLVSKRIWSIYRSCGPVHTSKYLKQVSFALQQYLGSPDPRSMKLSFHMSLTKSGLPRFIPVIWRKRLSRENPDITVVKIVFSICSLYKVMAVVPRSKKLFDTTTIDPVGMKYNEVMISALQSIRKFGYDMLLRCAPDFWEEPLELGYSNVPIMTAPASMPRVIKHGTYLSLFGLSGVFSSVTPFATMALDGLNAYRAGLHSDLLVMVERLFYNYTLYPDCWPYHVKFRDSRLTRSRACDILFSCWSPSEEFLLLENYRRAPPSGRDPVPLGRLSRKIEGGGKVRNFAICNQYLQRSVYSFHEWAMTILSRIEMDGTYDQLSPLHRLSGHRVLYSFDLKSATDLFPSELTYELLRSCFGEQISKAWHYIVSNVAFRVPFSKGTAKHPYWVRFTRGQPLGFYSSWALFSLTHHVVVTMAADIVYPGKRFTDYAILGDDIVIADDKVAKAYSKYMTMGGAVISMEKTLISFNGSCEFAKRFIIHNHDKSRRADVSPTSIPLLRLLDRYVAPAVFSKLGCDILSSFRLRGASYKVYACLRPTVTPSLWESLSQRWRRHLLLMFSPGGPRALPYEIWLTFPNFWLLDCYTYGKLYNFLLSCIDRRDLDIESFSAHRLLYDDKNVHLLEAHYRPLVERFCQYFVWLAKADCLEFTLDAISSPSPPLRSIGRPNDRLLITRYGPRFKLWEVALLVRAEPWFALPQECSRADIPEIWMFRERYPGSPVLSVSRKARNLSVDAF